MNKTSTSVTKRPPRSRDRKRAPKRRRSSGSSSGSIVYVSTYPSERLRGEVPVVDLTLSDESICVVRKRAEHPKTLRTVYFSARNFSVRRCPRNVTSLVALPRERQVFARSRSDPSLMEESACPNLLPGNYCDVECSAWTDPGEGSWGTHEEEEEWEDSVSWN